MKLKLLLEMIREDGKGAEEFPVLFASFKQNSAGGWQEVVRRVNVSRNPSAPHKVARQ